MTIHFKNYFLFYVALMFGALFLSCSSSSDSTQAGGGGGGTSCESRTLSRVLRSLAVDPTNDSILYVGVEGRGVYKSTDAGSTWTKIVNGIQGASTFEGSPCFNEFRDISIAASDSNKICVSQSSGPNSPSSSPFGTVSGPYCSSDAGLTWARGVTGLRNVGGYSIKIDPNTANTVYYGVGDDISNPTSGTGVIYKSTDLGSVWTELNTSYTSGQSVNRIEVDPSNSNNIFASMMYLVPQGTGVDGGRYSASQVGMIASVNAGSTFTVTNSGMASVSPLQQAITDLTVSSNGLRVFAVTADSTNAVRNYYSHDASATFTASGLSSIDYAEFNPNDATGNILLGINNGLLIRSANGGVGWGTYGTLPTLPSGERFTVIRWSFQSSNIIYIGADKARVYRSADAGLTWTQILSEATLPL